MIGQGGNTGREKLRGVFRKQFPIAFVKHREALGIVPVFLTLTSETSLKPRRRYQKYRKIIAKSAFRSQFAAPLLAVVPKINNVFYGNRILNPTLKYARRTKHFPGIQKNDLNYCYWRGRK